MRQFHKFFARLKQYKKVFFRRLTDLVAIIFFCFIAIFFIILFSTDPNGGSSLFKKAHVTCYSGSQVIYEGDAKYVVFNANYTFWRDIKTKKKIKTTANCVAKW
jgi:hypothetical protein